MRWYIRGIATAVPAALVVASGAPVYAQLPAKCADRPLPDGTAVLAGTVVASGSRVPLQMAAVEVSWWESGRRTRPVEAETDSTGSYTLCAVAGGTQLRVQAVYLGTRVTELGQVPAGEVGRVDLTVEIEGETVTGRVQVGATGESLEGVALRLDGTPAGTASDAEGRFRFEGLPAGSYHLTASHIGYPEITRRFAVNVGEQVDLTVRMSQSPITLEPLLVEVRHQRLAEVGFYERRERGTGVYLTKTEIEAKHPLMASDALRGIAGLTFQSANWGPYQQITGRRGCPFRYFVNGGRAGDNFLLDELPKDWLEAIEIYRGPSSVPADYVPATGSVNAACGVILVWLTNAAHDFRKD